MKMSFFTVIFFFLNVNIAHAETVVGRWCDQMVPNNPKFRAELTLVIKDDGDVVMRSKYADGSGRTEELTELGNEIYKKRNNRYGEKYRIVPSTGSLQLIDSDGLIRTARRLENEPQNRDCLP